MTKLKEDTGFLANIRLYKGFFNMAFNRFKQIASQRVDKIETNHADNLENKCFKNGIK